MEKPWTSDAAQWYAVLSMMVVVISTITFVFSTLESENEEESHPIVLLAVEIIGLRARFCFGISIAYNSDITCVVIFSLEYGVRFLCAPQRVSFFKDPMNLGFKLFIQVLRSNRYKHFSWLFCPSSLLRVPGARGAWGLSDYWKGRKDHQAHEGSKYKIHVLNIFLESLFKGDENPTSVQTFSSLCRSSIPDLHPEPGLQGAGLTPSHYQ